MFFLTIKFANFQTNSVSKSHRKKYITLFNVVTISECLVEKQKYIYSLLAAGTDFNNSLQPFQLQQIAHCNLIWTEYENLLSFSGRKLFW